MADEGWRTFEVGSGIEILKPAGTTRIWLPVPGAAATPYQKSAPSTYREPTVRGCGTGDIRFMLESKNLGGKCADLNALFVGLLRAAGLPARDVYGIRVGRSQLGYTSLGASSEVVTN